MSELNGSEGGLPQIKMVNPVADMLRNVLAMVESGQVVAAGVVMVDPSGAIGTPFAGNISLSFLHTGAVLLGKRLMDTIESPQQPRSGILRPTASMR